MSEEDVYTYEEVKTILCDACKLRIPDTLDADSGIWHHYINEVKIPCNASIWRNKET